ncbi:HAMP domain-containing sensor histidine kinase [Pseudonocardia sp.]|uniref:sensor histidine kinase n=1 Tax=Pseudonocardia sp. TaxID=60912 RepID=UPI002F417561
MRHRVVGLTVLTAVLAIAMFAVPLAAIVAKFVIDDERSEVERVANAAAVSVSADLARGHPPGALPVTERDTHIAVYDIAGTRIAGNGPARGDRHVGSALRGHQGSGNTRGGIVVAVPITNDAGVQGAVWADTSRTETYHRIATIWLLMAGLAIGALVTVWLVARALAGRLSRPLERLAAAASVLGDGDFSVRSPPAGVAEIDAVAAALNSTAARLADLLARERAFSADASHQLRTPLTGLRLGLEVALDDPEQDPRDAIVTAIAGADRLQRTIEDLLRLARGSPRDAGPLDLSGLLSELETTWGQQLSARGRALVVTAAPRTPVSSASTAAVRQILSVLLDNALTHGAGTVRVTARDAGNTLAIDVSDQGGPLHTPSHRLFARRHADSLGRAPDIPGVDNSAGRSAGHGIGLALARSLAEAEGGRLLLSRPEPPTFTLLAPAEQPTSPSGQTEDSVPPVEPVSAARS